MQELSHRGFDACSTLLRVSYRLSPAWVTLQGNTDISKTYITQKEGTRGGGEQSTSPAYNGVARIAGIRHLSRGSRLSSHTGPSH